MKNIKPKKQQFNVVFRGDFNPKIFHPSWFQANKILTKSEVNDSKIEIIHSDIARFEFDWLRIEVMRDRFLAAIDQEPYVENLIDLVIGTFNILHHTPIHMMGINVQMSFELESTERRHNFGHLLAPKNTWKGILDSPGMFSIEMQGNLNRRDCEGYTRVKIGPAKKIQNGVTFDVNDHYSINNKDIVSGSNEINNILKSNWKESFDVSKSIIFSLMEKA